MEQEDFLPPVKLGDGNEILLTETQYIFPPEVFCEDAEYEEQTMGTVRDNRIRK